MGFRSARVLFLTLTGFVFFPASLWCQSPAESSSSNSPKHIKKPAAASGIDAGVVTNGLYRNKTLAMSCKIPAGWVLRTEEMNARDEDSAQTLDSSSGENPHFSQKQGEVGHPSDKKSSSQRGTEDPRGSRVLLAAFSRPPAAQGEEVNSSILIAAESVAAYPGLKEAGQYFGPLTEVAKAQGFTVDEEPYEIALGEKVLVRGDFHKDVGSRKMWQSTLAFLSHGHAVSITVIGGTEEEVEELIDGLEFVGK